MKSLHDIYEKTEKEIDSKRLTVHLHAEEYSAISRFIESLNRPPDTYTDIGSDGIWSIKGLIVQVHLTETETFKDAQPILQWFLEHGWIQAGQTEDANWGDYSIGYRQIEFKKQGQQPMFWIHHELSDHQLQLKATVRMWPHRNSANCRRVEAGTEIKYKLVCE